MAPYAAMAVLALASSRAVNGELECFRTVASSDKVNFALSAAMRKDNATGLSLLPWNAAHADVRVLHDTSSRKFLVHVTNLKLLSIMASEQDVPSNREVIGAHLHTGRAAVNGPININLCGSPPLPPPALVGVRKCPSASDFSNLGGTFSSTANNATAVSGATTLADGAATSYRQLAAGLTKCTKEACPVFFNLHTNYSFALNPGAWGVARGQLSPVPCDRFGLE
jgi:hypothetical protein